jgi:hypothetical protein
MLKKSVLLGLFFSQVCFSANVLNMYFIRSPLKINWKSPKTLTRSTIVNSILPIKKYKHPISHTAIELKCDNIDGKPVHVLGGMTTAEDNEANNLILKQGLGMGILYYAQKGKLQSAENILGSIEHFKGKERLNRLSIAVNDAACERMYQFYTGWNEREYFKKYSGFNAVPRNGDGAGCAEYAISFLEVAGLLHPELKRAWSFLVTPPQKYIGGELTGQKVSVLKILFDIKSRWDSQINDLTLEIWEPSLMHKWVKKMVHRLERGAYKGELPLEIEYFNQEKNLGISMNLVDWEAPTDPIWYN